MEVEQAVDAVRSALSLAIVLSTPALVTGLAVGIFMGLLQAITQIQDITIGLIPRIVLTVLIVLALLPWSLSRLVDYSDGVIRGIPSQLSSG